MRNMKNIANLSAKLRNALIISVAEKTGLSEAIVEKDFWVCFILDYLFKRCPWKDNFVFKGGTSLSKAYNLIQRFSEDIDLIIDWRILGYKANEPWIVRSNTKQDAFNKEANARASEFIAEKFLPAALNDLHSEIKQPFDIQIDKKDPLTINFLYPKSYSSRSILQEIRLEMGALAAWSPYAICKIKPYVAERHEKLFDTPFTEVKTVLPERTFWEKITILHRESFRPEGSPLPHRYSRHYYDVYCMMNSPVKEKALKDLALLEKVVSFKDKFYHSPWGRYDLARPGSIRLMPPEHNIQALRSDYEQMLGMLYGDKPTFDEIMGGLALLEEEINHS